MNSNSKYSSLGGTHSLDKKRQKIKNAIKKKREKPISSSKKSEKETAGSAAFTDPSFVKNYRSANLTKNNGKNIINQNDTSQKRYQYHKRIRSDTGNILPLEQMNENKFNSKTATSGIPTIAKITTDLNTPAISSEDYKFSINSKKSSKLDSKNANGITLNKYDFVPSFSHHKNVSLDVNSQYRKIKANKNLSNAHKIDLSKLKKPQKQITMSNNSKYEERSQSQVNNPSSEKYFRVKQMEESILNYSPAQYEVNSGAREISISEIDNSRHLINDSYNEYLFDQSSHFADPQVKPEPMYNYQHEGDHSISISKETEEAVHLPLIKKKSSELVNNNNIFMSKKPVEKLRESHKSEEKVFEVDRYSDIKTQEGRVSIDQNKPHTKVVQIDWQSLNPWDMTKSKEDLIEQIKLYILENGKEPETKAKFYRVGKLLGRGAFGKVSLGMHKATNQLVAIKSINKEFLEEERSRRKVAKEVSILKKLQHKNIVNLYETFETEKHFLLVTELWAGGDLLSYVRRRRKLTEDYAKYFFKQLIEAWMYWHKKGVVHRDIKLDNILLDHQGTLKLCDFGVSRAVK